MSQTPNYPPIELINRLTQQIHNHFNDKYPKIYPAMGIGINGVQKLVEKSLSVNPKDDKTTGHKFGSRDDVRVRMNNLVALLESQLKTQMYKGTRIGVQPNPAKHITDPLVDIPYSSYTNQQPENLIIKKPDVHPDPVSNKVNNTILEDSISNDDTNLISRPINQHVPDNLHDAVNQSNDKGQQHDNNYTDEAIATINKAHEIINTSGAARNVTYVEDRTFDYYIAIDSKDRNRSRNESPNEFIIDFSPGAGSNASNGYINTAFGNIISCELLNVVMLETTGEPDSTDSTATGIFIPYIILEIPELERRIEGTNDNLNKAFAILSDYTVKNGYKHYNINTNHLEAQARVVFNPRRTINRITVRLLQPDGTLFNFGSANDENERTIVHLLFKITTLQKNLGSNYIGNAFH